MNKKQMLIGLMVAFATLLILSLFASKLPDSLERLAESRHFSGKEKVVANAPLADYSLPGLKNKKLALASAAIAGAVIAFLLSYWLAFLLKRKNKN